MAPPLRQPIDGKGNSMQSPVVRARVRISLMASLLLFAWTPRAAAADVCVSVDEARDTFTAQGRSAALLLLARQFELEGERVVPPGCPNGYMVSHIQFGTRITITLSGPKGQRDATAKGMDDVPAVYSQMVRSLIRGQPMDAPGIVDRTNVSDTQASAPNRIHSDSLYYARLGYGAIFGEDTYGVPSIGVFGYRHERDRLGIDVSFLNIQYKSVDSSYVYGSTSSGSWLKLELLRFTNPVSDRSLYFGGGLSWSYTDLDAGLDNGYTSWHGSGLQGELTAGLELGRASSMLVFVQGDVGLPFYETQGDTYTYSMVPPYTHTTVTTSRYAPSVTVSFGLGWQRGAK